MSWELTSFLILGAVLLAGFAWYERSRPPSQVVALVAALAALAIAGRIAFAAFPNVKPTTDIVVFAGYALGGAPGFAVGALAALVSNFWFGQGPWTPWQMAGWGLCGILGAGLALGSRNAGRFALAATCGFAGILYGALLNFSLMATYGGDLSLERFGVLEARAIPFDAAHVAANIALALVAGPAMVRMLVRFRERFEWRRGDGPAPVQPRPRLGAPLRGGGIALLLVLLAAIPLLAAAPAQAASVDRAAAWLESVQNPDGGFGRSPGKESGAETTCWVMLGLAAAGTNPLDVSRAGRIPVDFLREEISSVSSAGDLARTILALEASGVDPRGFGGRNLVAELIDSRGENGSYHGWPGSTAFAVLALRAAGVDGGTERSLEWLRKVQNEDGGWGDYASSPSTSDGTGAVLQVLSPDSKVADRAVQYLRGAQQKGGGFPLGSNGPINTQSTAWAVQGLLAAGRNPASYKRGGASGLDYIAANQRADGSYRYAVPGAATPSEVADQTPVFVTGEVLVAASGRYYPLAAPARAPQPAPASSPGLRSSGGLPSSGAAVGTSKPLLPVSPGGAGSGAAGSGGAAVGGVQPAPAKPKGGGAPGTVPLPKFFDGGPADGSAAPGEASPQPLDEAAGEQAAATTAGGGTAGAILLGLLAGCLLFLLGLGARRGWMRWRYGL